MKKAVIATGGKQYLVTEGQELEVELVANGKSVEFDPLLIIDGESAKIGTPMVTGSKVTATVLDQEVKAEKVVAIRYKAKKRVKKVRGHRQKHAKIKIAKIA